MARAGIGATPPHPHHTRPDDVLQRPPVADLAAGIGELVADALESGEPETPGVLALDSESIIADSATATETGAEEGSRVAAAAGG